MQAKAEAALRECVEEIGVAPEPLIELFTYLTSPGLCDEEITLFLGVVDAARVPARAGAAAEHENIVPVLSYSEEGEFPYLVMPFIEGQTLKEFLASHVAKHHGLRAR